MSEAVICALERTEKPNKVRKQGFVPGVMYGKDIKSTSIKLEQKKFMRFLHGHAKNTKVRVQLGNDVKHCIVKDVQKDFINGQILHVELQAIDSNDVIRLKVPVVFQGKEELSLRKQVLQVHMPEVEIMGKAADMPEFVCIDVEDRKLGDKITVKDIQVPKDIKILDDESEIVAVISAIKEYSEVI
ncbi:MAG TPA: 50S ribosomal protein L25 [Acetivibrio sp.]|nr:50S ribosomal protein L25 [Clostridium sp.]HPT91265.1 50S ribosomal protein L25 [Acetivibrio sp.]HQA58337.1 50S ribosomal protein L25 [Acetivibrio sp.]